MDPTMDTPPDHSLSTYCRRMIDGAEKVAVGRRSAGCSTSNAAPGLWRSALLFIILAACLTGCETHKHKPWETRKPSWIERNLAPDDRAFYQDFFFRD